MLLIITAIIISYLIGSVPTGYLFGKLSRGIDIRNFGSGNVGATNAWRVLGKKTGVLVLLIDLLKGVLPVVLVADFFLSRGIDISPEAFRLILALSCISGHNWTVFLKFKGGKGVATTLGVLIGLSLVTDDFAKIFGLVIFVWLVVFLISRMVSLASISAGISFPVWSFIFKMPYAILLFSFLTAVLIILRHRSNLRRIIRGEESRLNLTKKSYSK